MSPQIAKQVPHTTEAQTSARWLDTASRPNAKIQLSSRIEASGIVGRGSSCCGHRQQRGRRRVEAGRRLQDALYRRVQHGKHLPLLPLPPHLLALSLRLTSCIAAASRGTAPPLGAVARRGERVAAEGRHRDVVDSPRNDTAHSLQDGAWDEGGQERCTARKGGEARWCGSIVGARLGREVVERTMRRHPAVVVDDVAVARLLLG